MSTVHSCNELCLNLIALSPFTNKCTKPNALHSIFHWSKRYHFTHSRSHPPHCPTSVPLRFMATEPGPWRGGSSCTGGGNALLCWAFHPSEGWKEKWGLAEFVNTNQVIKARQLSFSLPLQSIQVGTSSRQQIILEKKSHMRGKWQTLRSRHLWRSPTNPLQGCEATTWKAMEKVTID